MDRHLLDQVRVGSRKAFSALLERHWEPLIRYVEEILPMTVDPQDIVQEVFVRIWAYRERWTPTGSATGYLYRITRNLALNARRDGNTRERALSERRREAALEESSRGPQEDLALRELQKEVSVAVASLPERRREIFLLARFHGLSHGEIAESMEISRQTVANQMSAALATLRDCLSHHFPRR